MFLDPITRPVLAQIGFQPLPSVVPEDLQHMDSRWKRRPTSTNSYSNTIRDWSLIMGRGEATKWENHGSKTKIDFYIQTYT